MTRRLVHIAEVDLSPRTGMGRVGWHWREESVRRNIPFVHIGPADVPAMRHLREFPAAALRAYQSMRQEGDCLLVHEPASGAFVDAGLSTIVVSHGLERRGWQARCAGAWGAGDVPSLRTRLLFPLWRLRGADRGLRQAAHILLLNQQDASFAERFYHRRPGDVTVLRHGTEPTTMTEVDVPNGVFTVLFLGSWLPRKGVETLRAAAELLELRGIAVHWLLAGTGSSGEDIRTQFPAALRGSVEVIPSFDPADEAALLRRAHAFVLPSFFEGQPLALLQAMASGRCCITTDCCGQRDVIAHGENGLLFAPGDADACATEIGRAASDPHLRQRLGQGARASMDGRTWSAAFDQVWKEITE
jgi:glycosyltransferase involved in cell wall biosynthesis